MTGFTSKRQMAQDKSMTRPVESDYISQVAYTRALEAYCDTLAQPEQEPFGYVSMYDNPIFQKEKPEIGRWETVYAAPPKHPWVGLTAQEVTAIDKKYYRPMGPQEFSKEIETALRSKNT